MDMQKVKSKSGKIFYIPYDDDGKVIMPIYEYLKHLAMNNSSKNTIRNNCSYLLVFWEYLKNHDYNYIDFVKKKDGASIQAYNNLAEYRLWLTYPDIHDKVIPIEGMKPIRKDSTANQMLSSVLSFYSFCEISGLVKDLPVFTEKKTLQHSSHFLRELFLQKQSFHKSILMAKVQPEEPYFVTSDEFKLCWDNCTSRRNRIIIGLMYYGGLRISEVVGLKIVDMRDLYKNVIHITERPDDDECPDAACKYHSHGTVVIDDILRDEIITYMNEDLHGVDTNYLIINFSGENKYMPMRADTIRDMIEGLSKKTGLSKIHPHAFRHGCAMRMLFAEMDLLSIADRLRHRNVSSTQIYTKMNIDAKIQVQEKLSKKLDEDYARLDIDFAAYADMLKEDDDE